MHPRSSAFSCPLDSLPKSLTRRAVLKDESALGAVAVAAHVTSRLAHTKLWLRVQLSKAALLRIAHGLAAALQPCMSHLECSSCGARTATLWCEGRSCRCARWLALIREEVQSDFPLDRIHA